MPGQVSGFGSGTRNPGPTCLPAAHQRGFVGAVWEPRLFLLRWGKVGFGAGVGWEQRWKFPSTHGWQRRACRPSSSLGCSFGLERQGQCLSRLKALQDNRREPPAGAFPSISESKACKGQHRTRPGPQAPSPPVMGKPQAGMLDLGTAPSTRSLRYSPSAPLPPAGSRTCCSSPPACWRPSAMLAPTATTTPAASASTWISTLTSKETPSGDTSTATCWRRWALTLRPWAGGPHKGLPWGDQEELPHHAEPPRPGILGTGTYLLRCPSFTGRGSP